MLEEEIILEFEYRYLNEINVKDILFYLLELLKEEDLIGATYDLYFINKLTFLKF